MQLRAVANFLTPGAREAELLGDEVTVLVDPHDVIAGFLVVDFGRTRQQLDR